MVLPPSVTIVVLSSSAGMVVFAADAVAGIISWRREIRKVSEEFELVLGRNTNTVSKKKGL